MKALPPALSVGIIPLLTAVLAVLLARWLWEAATALPVPTIDVPLHPGPCVFVCVVLRARSNPIEALQRIGVRRTDISKSIIVVSLTDTPLHRSPTTAITQDDGVTVAPSKSQELLVRTYIDTLQHAFNGGSDRNLRRRLTPACPADNNTNHTHQFEASALTPSAENQPKCKHTGQEPTRLPAVLRPRYLAVAGGGAHHDGQGRACIDVNADILFGGCFGVWMRKCRSMCPPSL